MRKHDLITFGQYIWLVLAIEEGHRALIITQDIIDLRWYHHQFVNITWAESALRHYLNGELYSSFDPQEQAKIMQVTNQNADNPWFNTEGGPDTTDHLFLLSLQEACQYFGDSRAKLSTKEKQTWLINDENNLDRQARYGMDFHGWRLRSPGYYGRTGASVTKQGQVYVRGNGVLGRPRDGGGVRPALWMRLEN